ncbi:MAG: heme ABC exporter ATP-binding protein CcmA [Alphaproteobacteria bacterium]|nr:heme ABC exporter ATP-binding protein CcmA [Alphaproteobacteria bacterium]
MSFALTVDGLALERGGRALFQDLSFAAAPGAFVELVGPNGAGKTSLLRALAGFLRPAGGRISATEDGAALDDDQRPTRLHLLGHRDGLKSTLDARAHLTFWRDLLGGGAEGASIDDALARVGLARLGDLPARAFSAGQGRRLALARLLVAPRPLWLLDEPAAALDRAGKALLGEVIAAHRATGGVVIAALHEPLDAKADATVTIGATP